MDTAVYVSDQVRVSINVDLARFGVSECGTHTPGRPNDRAPAHLMGPFY